MSERITIVSVPGMDYGCDALTRDDAIAQFRASAEYQKAEAEKWLAIPIEQLKVFRCTGPYAQRNKVDLK